MSFCTNCRKFTATNIYRILASSYQNAIEFSLQTSRLKWFMSSLKKGDHFLVYTGYLEKDGIYIIADPLLMNEPETIRALIKGYSSRSPNSKTSARYLLFICIQEPLVWEGPIVDLKVTDASVDIRPGHMRLVCEGGTNDLKEAQDNLASLTGRMDFLEVASESISQLTKVNNELARMRKILYRISMSVIADTCKFRKTFKGYPETVHSLFSFAREFGQRGINIMDESRRGHVAINLINLCIEWLSFICDDCVPTDIKTFRWTVIAIEFTMVMTRGVNIVALSDEQFTKLRLKVAGCMTLLISHFDIMGARSTAERRQRMTRDQELNKTRTIKDDVDLIKEFHNEVSKKINLMEGQLRSHQNMGKVIDESDANSELLTYLASNFSSRTFRWQQGRFIGGGSFGSVYAAVDLDSGSVMAMKEIRMQDPQSMKQVLKSIRDEMTVLEMLRHPNIVEYKGVEVHRDRVFIFMEYCQGGSLAKLLEYGRIEDENVIQVYTMQMLQGLKYLHMKGVVHRDIKPENILLDHVGVIKFVDFGAAKVIANSGRTRRGGIGTIGASTKMNGGDGSSSKMNSMTGTPMYMSPEVITGTTTGSQSSIDIWSLGCCVLEMATGRRPWANLDNEWAIMYHIAAGQLPQLPSADQMSEQGLAFLMRTLQRDPLLRPTATELLQDPWIQNSPGKAVAEAKYRTDGSGAAAATTTPTTTTATSTPTSSLTPAAATVVAAAAAVGKTPSEHEQINTI